MEELHVGIAGGLDQLGVDLVRAQQGDALVPDLLGLAHRDPHVGVEEVDSLDAFCSVVGDENMSSTLLRQLLGLGHHLGRRLQFLGSHHPHIHSHERG